MEENTKKRRIFMALNLPEEVKKELSESLFKLNREVGGVKWVKPNGFHLTLHFLGYLDEPQIEKVMAVMDELAKKFGSMNFEAGGIGAFPALTNPRVFFLDCRQTNGDSVYKFQAELGRKIEEIGIATDKRPWKTHLTLGRVNPIRNTSRVLNFASRQKGIISNGVKTKLPQNVYSLAKYVKMKNKNFTVKSFELVESKLKPDGAEYKVVVSCKL